MLLPLGVSPSYVLMDATLALTAFGVGVLVAYWYFASKTAVSDKTSTEASLKGDESHQLDAERTNMAVKQLKDLASTVAADVDSHNQFVSGISDRLGSLDVESPDRESAVTEALGEILIANEKLQKRLAEAEKKIQVQAEELKTQESEARTDSLTKLANRRAFDDGMAKSIENFKRDGRPLSLLLFDIDHFKKFNDTYGHQAGDEVLREVAATLSKTAKSSDLAFRYGGEEMGVVMPNTSMAQAKIAVERIRKAIASTVVRFQANTLSVTASMGVAEVGPSDDVARLIRRADEAIYSAKEAGRNCSYWHDGDDCLPLEEHSAAKAARPSATPEKALSHRDLPNRTVFSAELQRRISESHRTGNSLALLHLKVVSFATLERDFGGAVADMMLDSVGQFIGSRLRDMDLLGHIDRGTYVVMLPGSTEKEATIVGNRVRTTLAGCPIPLGTTQLTLQLSQSVTTVQPADDAVKMLDRITEVRTPELVK